MPASPSKVPLPPSSLATSTALPDLLAALSDRLAETEMSIEFLLNSTIPLSDQIESFPLLDRAKFCVTLNYAIDSILFCLTPPGLTDAGYLRAKGANFKDHPVMKELERVKVYIRKLNAAEQVPTDRM
jgi:exosome complex protein LRP1